MMLLTTTQQQNGETKMTRTEIMNSPKYATLKAEIAALRAELAAAKPGEDVSAA
jgi:hypothetical protein